MAERMTLLVLKISCRWGAIKWSTKKQKTGGGTHTCLITKPWHIHRIPRQITIIIVIWLDMQIFYNHACFLFHLTHYYDSLQGISDDYTRISPRDDEYFFWRRAFIMLLYRIITTSFPLVNNRNDFVFSLEMSIMLFPQWVLVMLSPTDYKRKTSNDSCRPRKGFGLRK